ncbi:MAG TPA: thioredoxin domain-containing protein [Candidatus Limnocylindrales bacterium]|nr:thioredoxin domain-containing protein [Candidatus Limnocylindrales bacterium]
MTRESQPPLTRRERRQLEREERPIRDRTVRDRTRSTSRRSPKRPAWQSPMVLVTGAALVVALAIIVLNQKPAPSADGDLTTPPIAYSAEIVDGDSMGSPDAPVVMEVYSDFQCPFCARFVREQFVDLKARFVDTGILRIVGRDIALVGGGEFDESLEMATGAVCAAAQDRYWQFHDVIFWNQGRENRGDHDAAFIAAAADKAGVERGTWDACIAGSTARGEVRSLTVTTLGRGITGTPTVVLNGGTPIAGLPDPAMLVAQIQALAASPSGGPTPVPTAAP